MWSNFKRWLLITKSRHLKLMIWVLLCLWEGARVWAHWNYSLVMHLNALGPVFKAQNAFCFSPSWILLRAHLPWASAAADGLILVEPEWWATLFVYWKGRQHSLPTYHMIYVHTHIYVYLWTMSLWICIYELQTKYHKHFHSPPTY